MEYFEVTDFIVNDLKQQGFIKYLKYIRNRTERYAISFYRDMSRSSFDNKEIQCFLVKKIRKGILRYWFTRYKLSSKLYGTYISLFPNSALRAFR